MSAPPRAQMASPPPSANGIPASRSAAAAFDRGLTARLRAALPGAPEVVSFAGHDAAILAERIPAAMVFVRNETGVSHCADEHVTFDDAAVAATALLEAVL